MARVRLFEGIGVTPADLADLIRQAVDSDDAAAVLDDALQELGLDLEAVAMAVHRILAVRSRSRTGAYPAMEPHDNWSSAKVRMRYYAPIKDAGPEPDVSARINRKP